MGESTSSEEAHDVELPTMAEDPEAAGQNEEPCMGPSELPPPPAQIAVTVDDDEDDNTCPICFTEEADVQMKCKHAFCRNCTISYFTRTWLHKFAKEREGLCKLSCPTCRAPVPLPLEVREICAVQVERFLNVPVTHSDVPFKQPTISEFFRNMSAGEKVRGPCLIATAILLLIIASIATSIDRSDDIIGKGFGLVLFLGGFLLSVGMMSFLLTIGHHCLMLPATLERHGQLQAARRLAMSTVSWDGDEAPVEESTEQPQPAVLADVDGRSEQEGQDTDSGADAEVVIPETVPRQATR